MYLFTTQPCKKEYPCLKAGKEHISNHINDPEAMDCDSDFFKKEYPCLKAEKEHNSNHINDPEAMDCDSDFLK